MSIQLQKDAAATLVKSFLPPIRGTWKTLPPHLLPDDVIQDSLNVTLRSGILRSRNGLTLYNRTNLGSPILGSFMNIDATNFKSPLVSTNNTLYHFVNNAWQDITNNQVLTNVDTPVRMASLQVGSFVYIIYANGHDNLRVINQSDYLLRQITPYTGSIPILSDVCTSFSRIVGIQPPYIVAWCDIVNNQYLSFTNWPSLNQAILSDTEDAIVAIAPLGTLGLAVYKEGNIFVGFAQAGTNAAAFRFEHRGEFEGPANPNAVIKVEGAHIRMTPTGRIGMFNGTQNSWICDGIWPFLQDDIDVNFLNKIFGVYNYKTAEVYFWYPRIGDNGNCTGMVIIDLPYPEAGIQGFSYFLGQSNFGCSNGLSIRLFQGLTQPLVFGNTNQTFLLDKLSYGDNGFDFPCGFSPGLVRPPANATGQDIFTPTLEIYSSRGHSGAGIVDVVALGSNVLESNGRESAPETLDLSQTPVNEFVGYADITGSYLGVKFSWDSSSRFEYKGCDIYGAPTV